MPSCNRRFSGAVSSMDLLASTAPLPSSLSRRSPPASARYTRSLRRSTKKSAAPTPCTTGVQLRSVSAQRCRLPPGSAWEPNRRCSHAGGPPGGSGPQDRQVAVAEEIQPERATRFDVCQRNPVGGLCRRDRAATAGRRFAPAAAGADLPLFRPGPVSLPPGSGSRNGRQPGGMPAGRWRDAISGARISTA